MKRPDSKKELNLREWRVIEEDFMKRGWVVLKLPDPAPALETRIALTRELRRLLGDAKATLENYGSRTAMDDQRHSQIQIAMTEFMRARRFVPKIIAAQLDFFKRFIGPDILIQTNPYLRIARPNKKQDNIGYHRDTFYGATAFEISISIPFVDVAKSAALEVISGSHLLSESHYPTINLPNPNPEITRGSTMHKIGFLYAPKAIKESHLKGLKSIPLKVGEALIFSLATVHGSVENRSSACRWSTDIRLMNALAPVDLNGREGYYEPLCDSALMNCGKKYLEANREKSESKKAPQTS